MQLGANFQAIVFAAVGKDESLRSLLEKAFQEHPHDASAVSTEWPKACICMQGGSEETEAGGSLGLQLDVPKLDLFAEIPPDCVQRMVSMSFLFPWSSFLR